LKTVLVIVVVILVLMVVLLIMLKMMIQMVVEVVICGSGVVGGDNANCSGVHYGGGLFVTL
jgi:hypothetical protein